MFEKVDARWMCLDDEIQGRIPLNEANNRISRGEEGFNKFSFFFLRVINFIVN